LGTLKLPDVTLVCVETREHELARLAVEDCVRRVEFGDVLVLTDRPLDFFSLTYFCDPRIITVQDWPEKVGWSRSWWFDVPPLLKTANTLNIQWDSWVWQPEMWRDEFLKYDYVGAPWWYEDGKNVGNGGFCLRSTALSRYIADRRQKYPCDTAVDDDLLCRKYRAGLEGAGFVWAPEWIARDFSYEGCGPPGHPNTAPPTKHFGFHAMFNWWSVLDRPGLIERTKIALKSKYITKSYIFRAFQGHPEFNSLMREIENG
jgi:hypothetical protein